MKIKIPKEQMLKILWGGKDVVEDTISDQRRWVTVHDLVFKHNDLFYRTWYEVGSTEYQDQGPWEDEEEVECTQVIPVERKIIVYEDVK